MTKGTTVTVIIVISSALRCATVLSRRKVRLLGDMAWTSDEHDFISYDKHEHIAGEINVGREEQGKK